MRRWFAMISVMLMASAASAHPHIWMDSYYKIDLKSPKVQNFEAHWTFDLFSSLEMLMAFDVDANGKLEGQEKADAAQAMTNLAQYGYFLQIQVDEEPVTPQAVTVVDVSAQDQKLLVRFGIELPEAVDLQEQTLRLGFGDPENYFALVVPDEGLLKLTGMMAEMCTPTPQKAEAFYMEGWIDLHCAR